MATILSHIVQKRLSQSYEDVATDALAYLVESNDQARRGLLKFLRGLVPELPGLYFRTQQADGSSRYDMRGQDSDGHLWVLFENKFWAGLTENQPVTYLENLAKVSHPTLLLFVVPTLREHTVWREIERRLDGRVEVAATREAVGASYCRLTRGGPVLALTTWTRVLDAIQYELDADSGASRDLEQLRALCQEADRQAFVPFGAEQLTDQRSPALLLQLGDVVQAAVEAAVASGALARNTRLLPQASWRRIGRYAQFPERGVGFWFGTQLVLWKQHGTPLWLVFDSRPFSRGSEVRRVVEPWARRQKVHTLHDRDRFCVAAPICAGEERDQVIARLVAFFREMAGVVAGIRTATPAPSPQDEAQVPEDA